MSKSDGIFIAEHIFELRHAAIGEFLDVKGEMADYIKEKNFFKHWRIRENNVLFYNEADFLDKPGAVIGFNKIAFVVFNPSTYNFFKDKAFSFWNAVSKYKKYKIPDIDRFGARTKCYVPSEKLGFKKIHEKIKSTLLKDDFLKITGKVDDLQMVLDITEKEYKVRLIIGPVKENEANRYFAPNSADFSKAGLYIDIDYFKSAKVKHDAIKKLLDDAMKITWLKIHAITKIIGI